MNMIKEDADKYQGLFNLMSKEHNLTLTISEMDDVIFEAQKVVKLLGMGDVSHHVFSFAFLKIQIN